MLFLLVLQANYIIFSIVIAFILYCTRFQNLVPPGQDCGVHDPPAQLGGVRAVRQAHPACRGQARLRGIQGAGGDLLRAVSEKGTVNKARFPKNAENVEQRMSNNFHIPS